MNNLFFSKVLLCLIMLLTACANTAPQYSQVRRPSDLWTWNSDEFYESKILGKIIVFTAGQLDQEIWIQFANEKNKAKWYDAAWLNKNEMTEISLLEGDYLIYARTSSWQTKPIKVTGGQTIFLMVEDKEMKLVEGVPRNISLRKSGGIYSKSDFEKRIKAKITASYDLTVDKEFKPITVSVYDAINTPKFSLNGENVIHEAVSNNNYKFSLKLSKGDNKFIVEALGADKKSVIKEFNLYIKTDKDLLAERVAAKEAERKKAEEERLRNIRLERDAKAKKAEEERVAREGDGSQDDLDCKKYGLKPQSQGYAECRMRLDLFRRENEKLKASNDANLRAMESARKADLQKRYEQEQRQKEVVANRESKCQMMKAQEYLRPTMGGFFESMQNANNVYENCMAGIPQITTNCSKDGMGNISCTSR